MELVSNAYMVAFFLGAIHALEVDHMIAVSVFVGSEPRIGVAAASGAWWGLGHSAVVLFVGGVLIWFDVRLPESSLAWGELAVGIALVLLGIWAFRAAKKIHFHLPDGHEGHGHLHQHQHEDPEHRHNHSGNVSGHHRHLHTAMGALHGLVGTAPVLALVPVTFLANFQTSLIYLMLFGLGTTISMASYSALAAMAVRGSVFPKKAIRMVSYVIAGATIGVGGWWVFRSIEVMRG